MIKCEVKIDTDNLKLEWNEDMSTSLYIRRDKPCALVVITSSTFLAAVNANKED